MTLKIKFSGEATIDENGALTAIGTAEEVESQQVDVPVKWKVHPLRRKAILNALHKCGGVRKREDVSITELDEVLSAPKKEILSALHHMAEEEPQAVEPRGRVGPKSLWGLPTS